MRRLPVILGGAGSRFTKEDNGRLAAAEAVAEDEAAEEAAAEDEAAEEAAAEEAAAEEAAAEEDEAAAPCPSVGLVARSSPRS